jgi:DNA-binding transcriptional MocR family regulator
MRADYLRLADEVAARIADGTLRPGDRLPTQRAYARRRGIAPSTATRVYRELVRRGLVAGEVGRGSFVRADPQGPGRPATALAEPSAAPVDLELNHPVVPGQADLLAPALHGLLRPDALADALRPIGVAGTEIARARFAGLVACGGWTPGPEAVLFAGNGRQAIAAALTALVPPGGRLGVEALTYPGVKSLARARGLNLVALPMDAAGPDPAALAAIHAAAPLHAVYVQPRAHNPLGVCWPAARRARLAQVLAACAIPVIEDAVWSFIAGPEADAPGPFAALLPGQTVLVDSMSKRLAPGLTVGHLVAPEPMRPALAEALRGAGALPGRVPLEAMVRWIGDGTLERVCADKRADALARLRLAHTMLPAPRRPWARGSGPEAEAEAGIEQGSYFFWWELPEPLRAEPFVAAALEHGIAVTPGSAFAADPRSTPRAVRIALASPPPDVLERSLARLAELARSAG